MAESFAFDNFQCDSGSLFFFHRSVCKISVIIKNRIRIRNEFRIFCLFFNENSFHVFDLHFSDNSVTMKTD